MKILVLDKKAEKNERVFEGKPIISWSQWAVMELDGVPHSFQVTHYNETDILPPGSYELSPKSFGLKNAKLTLDRVVLVPAKSAELASVKPAAAAVK